MKHTSTGNPTALEHVKCCFAHKLFMEYVGEYHNELCELVLTLLVAGHALGSS